MYYRLKPRYILRGWDKLPTGVVDISCGDVVFETVKNFNALRMCTGRIDFDSILVSDEVRMTLKDIIQYLEESDSPMKRIFGWQSYKRYDNRFIRSVHWSITGKCNYRCRHCYMSAPEGKMSETSLEDCIDIINQMSECGIFSVSLTGGEPLVHPHFWEITDYLLEKKIQIKTVYSNGFLVNDDTLKKFEERGIRPEFSLSFDGTGGWHSWLRGIEDADVHIESAFKLCRDRGFDTSAELCLHKGNVDRLGESIDYLTDLGCSFVKVNKLNAEGNAVSIADKYLSSEEAADAYFRYLPEFFSKGCPIGLQLGSLFAYSKGKIIVPGYKFEQPIDESKYCMCGHARNVMYITCEGRVLPCIPFEGNRTATVKFEKIKDASLKTLLTDSYYFTCISTTLEKYFEHNPGCATCEYKYNCAGGCRGYAVCGTEKYDLLAVDEETCSYHKKGYYRRVFDMSRRSD